MCSILSSKLLRITPEFMHFTAEAGNVYYFRERIAAQFLLLIDPMDSDEARYLIDRYPLSMSQPKK
jgi:hypothetical protein